MSEWEFVKHRTAAEGAVWCSLDGAFYNRTGDASLGREADFQRLLADLGYPVPKIVAAGVEDDGQHFFMEHSLGKNSLHDEALASYAREGQVGDSVLSSALDISIQLMEAQSRNPLPRKQGDLWAWFRQAGFAANIFTENPDLDTPRTSNAVERALNRLKTMPFCHSHLDYGLPNTFLGGVIDWLHHGPAPLGYDVYPILDIVAFKGGNKGYRLTDEQRARYIVELDEAAARIHGRPLSEHLGDFLLVKCFFFLALMRPSDPNRHDKHVKWRYRRTLFRIGLDQYESSYTVRTEEFPTLAEFHRLSTIDPSP